jgi:hypothetical protein
MTPNLSPRRAAPSPSFQPISLAKVLLNLFGRRKLRPRTPVNPEWEREEPMSGLS